MCPHCVATVLVAVVGSLVGLPIVGVLFWRLRSWLKRRIKHT